MSSAASPPRKRTKGEPDVVFTQMYKLHNSFLHVLQLILDETKDDSKQMIEVVVQTLESQIAMSQQGGDEDDEDDWANSREPVDRYYTIHRNRSNRQWIVSNDLIGRRNYKPTFFSHKLILGITIHNFDAPRFGYLLNQVVKNMYDIPTRKYKAGIAKFWRVTIEAADSQYFYVIKTDKYPHPLMHQSRSTIFPKNDRFDVKYNKDNIHGNIVSISIHPPHFPIRSWFNLTKFLAQTQPAGTSSSSSRSSSASG